MFLDIVSGVESQHRVTNSQLENSFRERYLAKITKQAPRMFTAMLRSLELMIMSNTSPLYLRIYAWWICAQSWATLRFDHHGGLNPKDVKIDSTALTALLTRSKTLGEDKSLHPRAIIIDAACYLHTKDCILTGWRLLSDAVTLQRTQCRTGSCRRCNLVVH